jgi:hypothetical protein
MDARPYDPHPSDGDRGQAGGSRTDELQRVSLPIIKIPRRWSARLYYTRLHLQECASRQQPLRSPSEHPKLTARFATIGNRQHSAPDAR